MKTNRKILFGLLTLSSFTTFLLLAAKCYEKMKMHKITTLKKLSKH
ncbi:variable surface lipoprotein [Mycoplasmopsis bovis]